jgi:hypothetical protein
LSKAAIFLFSRRVAGAVSTGVGTMQSSSSVEHLLATIDAIPAGQESFQMWVPSQLTLQDEAVLSELAMGFLLDRIVGKGLYPRGFEEGDGGRLYKYATTLSA